VKICHFYNEFFEIEVRESSPVEKGVHDGKVEVLQFGLGRQCFENPRSGIANALDVEPQ